MMDLAGDRPPTKIIGVVPTVIESIEFSLSTAVLDAVPLMEKRLLNYLKTLDVQAVKKSEVDIQTILPNSFRSIDANL